MKIALGIEYDGARYFGWQRQDEVESVQQTLETALSKVANAPVEVFCAGRTDSGVHGTGQVVHFETDVVRPMQAWCFGTNANLPDDIAVKWAVEVDDSFHARFSATARRYRAAKCQSHTPWRNVHHLQVSRRQNYIIVDIQANAFVHHMVRNIVGSLIEVGQGKQPPIWIKWLLEQKDRTLAAPTAKAEGLYLVDVIYPEHYGLPHSSLGPLFLPDEA